KYRRLYKTDFDVFSRQVSYFRSFVLESGALRSIVQALEAAEPELDPDAWVEKHFTYQTYDWPPTETGQMKVIWRLINRWADGEDSRMLSRAFSTETKFNAALRDMTERTIEPFVEYLQERLGTESEVLHILERFVRRLEEFDVEELYAAYA